MYDPTIQEKLDRATKASMAGFVRRQGKMRKCISCKKKFDENYMHDYQVGKGAKVYFCEEDWKKFLKKQSR